MMFGRGGGSEKEASKRGGVIIGIIISVFNQICLECSVSWVILK